MRKEILDLLLDVYKPNKNKRYSVPLDEIADKLDIVLYTTDDEEYLGCNCEMTRNTIYVSDLADPFDNNFYIAYAICDRLINSTESCKYYSYDLCTEDDKVLYMADRMLLPTYGLTLFNQSNKFKNRYNKLIEMSNQFSVPKHCVIRRIKL